LSHGGRLGVTLRDLKWAVLKRDGNSCIPRGLGTNVLISRELRRSVADLFGPLGFVASRDPHEGPASTRQAFSGAGQQLRKSFGSILLH
jgi:hypothetical protein